VRALAGVLGELLLTGGVVLLLFVVYELWVTDLLAAQDQDRLASRLHQQWSAAAPSASGAVPAAVTPPRVGQPFAFLHIPRLGSGYARAVVEGAAQEQLAQGPGHYQGTAMPGQIGNFAVAGHRVGKGSPFLDLDTLRPGDPLVVETAGGWYVYRVLGDPATGSVEDASGIPGQEVVQPADVGVIAPVPDDPAAAAPTRAYLTLTTCNPKFSARTRLIVHAVLDGAPVAKADEPNGPPALREQAKRMTED
jgi:sortase A